MGFVGEIRLEQNWKSRDEYQKWVSNLGNFDLTTLQKISSFQIMRFSKPTASNLVPKIWVMPRWRYNSDRLFYS